MSETRSDAQMRTASMLLALECALGDLYPGRVSGEGTLWDRKIHVWINDLKKVTITFQAEDSIIARISENSEGSGESSGSGSSGIPEGFFKVEKDAPLGAVQDFIEDVVLSAADTVAMNPKNLVYKIAEVAANPQRLVQAATNIGMAPPALYQPG